MYPNPMDVLPLPERPDIDQYRKRAKDLSRACKSGGKDAIREWAAKWITDVASATGASPSGKQLDFLVERITDYAHERMTSADCALTQAQFLIARAHGFTSWPKFAEHVDAIEIAASGTGSFERAVDAIILGDIDTLRTLLHDQPALVTARSSREHGGTLLHYVAANGVENYRQKTPPNIVEIARLLLDAGAKVDAEAGMYGGGATTLGLAVTSAHPRQRGVQIELAELLIARGAKLYSSIIRDCLANGCPEAAVYLAQRGAYLDFQGACGVGNVERATSLLEGLSLASPEVNDAVNMAVWYNRTAIVSLLLDRGLDPATQTTWNSEKRTILHLAAWCGHAEMVQILLARGAPANMPDERWKTNPLTWALHGWLVDQHGEDEEYRVIVPALVYAGASVESDYLSQEKLRQFPEVLALLERAAT